MDKKPSHKKVPNHGEAAFDSPQNFIDTFGLAVFKREYIDSYVQAILKASNIEYESMGILYADYKGTGERRVKYYILSSPAGASCLFAANKLVFEQGVVLVFDGIDVYFVNKHQTAADRRILFDVGWSFVNSISNK